MPSQSQPLGHAVRYPTLHRVFLGFILVANIVVLAVISVRVLNAGAPLREAVFPFVATGMAVLSLIYYVKDHAADSKLVMVLVLSLLAVTTALEITLFWPRLH